DALGDRGLLDLQARDLPFGQLDRLAVDRDANGVRVVSTRSVADVFRGSGGHIDPFMYCRQVRAAGTVGVANSRHCLTSQTRSTLAQRCSRCRMLIERWFARPEGTHPCSEPESTYPRCMPPWTGLDALGACPGASWPPKWGAARQR